MNDPRIGRKKINTIGPRIPINHELQVDPKINKVKNSMQKNEINKVNFVFLFN